MKYVSAISLLALCACDSTATYTAVDSASASASPTTPSIATTTVPTSNSSPTEPSYTVYLYALKKDSITAYPTDPTTGDLINPQYGTWRMMNGGSSTSLLGYTSMFIQGSYLYAYSPGNTGYIGQVFQYSINTTSVYSTYGTNIPLTALSPAYETTDYSSTSLSANGFMTLGSDGNVYVQCGNTSFPSGSVDQFSLSNGMLSSTYNRLYPAGIPVTLDFTQPTSVSVGQDTYTIDTQTNRIDHYRNGLIQQSFNPIFGMPTVISVK